MDIRNIALAILEHSIKPYAKSSKLDINKLIDEIAKINYKEINLVESIPKQKKKRGRPKGSKNKTTINIDDD